MPEYHIHMVVHGVPKMSPSDVMQVIKSISAREFFKCYPDIKKKYFWGGKLWTQSYFVEAIGNANEDVIRSYVRNQLKEYEKKLSSLAAEFFINKAVASASAYTSLVPFIENG